MDFLSHAIQKLERRWQFLLMMYEVAGGKARHPVDAEKNARERLGMEREELDDIVGYYWGSDYFDRWSNINHMSLSHVGVDAVLHKILEIREVQTSSQPRLVLERIRDGRPRENRVARLIGREQFDGLNREVGTRQLFFLHLLFRSKRSLEHAGDQAACVFEAECVDELRAWSALGFRSLGGEDRDTPAIRVKKDWHDFVIRMNESELLKGLFIDLPEPEMGVGKIYAVHLPPHQLETQIVSVHEVLSLVAKAPPPDA